MRATVPRDYRDGNRNVTLIGFCRGMRRGPSEAEQTLWKLLRKRGLSGAKFRRQHQFGPYILDFFCPERNLAIEVDGGQHFEPDAASKDEARTRYLAGRGIRVVRFTNVDVLQRIEVVGEVILAALDDDQP